MIEDMGWNFFFEDPSKRSLSIEPQEVCSLNTIISDYNQISCENIDYVNIACEIL